MNMVLAQVETEEKKRETTDSWTDYCPVCKKDTPHKPCFFDAFYCTVCKVIRVPRE